MGYIKHHAMVVTSCDEKKIKMAHKKALTIFDHVSGILPSVINTYYSFFIPPDGSKEEWETSNEYNRKRAKFSRWLSCRAYKDGGNPFDWVTVWYDEMGQVGIEHE